MSFGKRLLLIGAGGHGRVVLEAARLAGWQVVGVLDDSAHLHGTVVDGVSVIGGVADLAACNRHVDAAIVALGSAVFRERVQELVRMANLPLACVVHPRSWVSEFAMLGEGTVVLAGAIVSVGARVGEGSIVNCNVMIDHDVRMEAFVHAAPQVGVGARAKVGRGATLGMGARILQDAVVAAGSRVAAGSMVGLRGDK